MRDMARMLREHGLRATSPRIAILFHLTDERGHPTADEIYDVLKVSYPSLSRTTVYNTLEVLGEKGIIRMINLDGKGSRYEATPVSHLHFYCKHCGTILDIEKEVPEHDGLLCGLHEVDEFHGHYHGTCNRCLKEGRGRVSTEMENGDDEGR